MKKFCRLLFFVCLIANSAVSYAQSATHADTLRGTYGRSRDWWDVLKYDIHVKFNIADSTISGYNNIDIKVLKPGKQLQIDLQDPMIIDSIFYAVNNQRFERLKDKDITKDGNAYFIPASLFSIPNTNYPLATIAVYYHGRPRIAKRAPWDGGLIWKRDENNNPWVSIACQHLGASVWYPCKDHQADEPDSAALHITCPDTLMAVGNGRFRGKILNSDHTATYTWAVTNPINNYNIIPYIGKYAHFSEVYKGEKGNLDMDYWVLDYNLEKAKVQFKDAARMMKAFEYWFGPYPFYEDGYKLVEAPHLGMEHQSAVAYGNGFSNGYKGTDLSGSGWGLKWDFIIVHESGHEWFANNITSKDIADMWIHESFTNYSETLFTEYYYGKDAATAYVTGTRNRIKNDKPIIGPYGVNEEGSGDMYYKGGNMIHTIRQVINNDSLFRDILWGLNRTFYHKTVTTKQVEDYISQQAKIDFSKVFDQYLRTAEVPVLEYKIKDEELFYRYTNCVKGFCMPLKVNFNGTIWIKPTEKWNRLKANTGTGNAFSIDINFYVIAKKVD
ncbi:MAG: M1 family metallopeptidase [Ferruginibacter sp.]